MMIIYLFSKTLRKIRLLNMAFIRRAVRSERRAAKLRLILPVIILVPALNRGYSKVIEEFLLPIITSAEINMQQNTVL